MNMAGPCHPSTNPRIEISLLEMNKDLCSQLERNQKDFQNLKEKFLICEATVYSLANKLKKSKCEMFKDIIEPILKKPQFEFEQKVTPPTPTDTHRKCNVPIQDQDLEKSPSQQKLQEVRAITQLIRERLWKLLVQQMDPNKRQEQSCRQQLLEILKLTECLIRKLDPESQDDPEKVKGDKIDLPPGNLGKSHGL